MFTFPWLRYQTSAPSFGSDYLAQLNYTPSKKTELFIRYRQRNNLLDAGNTENISFPINRKLESVRFNVIFPAGAYIRLRSRADFVRFSSSEANATGFLFFDYRARIYAYESDVLYSFSVPGFYGQGSRSYILLNASLGKHIECWLRYAITAYSDRMIISPGSLAEIQGPNRSDVRMQLRYSF
jgi:hypothetical protein